MPAATQVVAKVAAPIAAPVAAPVDSDAADAVRQVEDYIKWRRWTARDDAWRPPLLPDAGGVREGGIVIRMLVYMVYVVD